MVPEGATVPLPAPAGSSQSTQHRFPFSEKFTFFILNFYSSHGEGNVPRVWPTENQDSSQTSKNQAQHVSKLPRKEEQLDDLVSDSQPGQFQPSSSISRYQTQV